nr:sulfurtransferase [Pseudalkalibacillus decolorationis]
MGNFVTVDWLKHRLEDKNVIPVDCRFDLKDPKRGYNEYHEAHIPGAMYADLEKHLSGKVDEHGGRHPLPDMEGFLIFLGSIGIDGSKTVVVYDAQQSAMAARLWWMLKYVGHKKVYVLDGGYTEWIEQNLPTTDQESDVEETEFKANIQKEMVAELTDVQSGIKEQGTVLIDARGEDRYAGRNEPIDPKAGHIPTAVNLFFAENLKDGKWKSIGQLEDRFQEYRDKEIISYCGSGVTACVNILALDEIGEKSKLYVGSWSDWCSYKEHEIESD